MRGVFMKDDLDPVLQSLGLATGLLSDHGACLSVNEDWFRDPWTSPGIADLGARPGLVLAALEHLFGPAITGPARTDTQAQWYDLGASGTYLTISKSHAEGEAVLGLGLCTTVTSTEGNTVQVWLQVPLIALTEGAPAQPVLNGALGAISAGLSTDAATLTLTPDTVPQLSGSADALAQALGALETAPVDPRAHTTWGSVFASLGLREGLSAKTVSLDTTVTASEVLDALNQFISLDGGLIAPIGNGGLYVVQQQVSDDVTDFGLRLQLPDVGETPPAQDGASPDGDGDADSVQTDDPQAADGDQPATANAAQVATSPEPADPPATPDLPVVNTDPTGPKFTLQIGKWLTGEDEFDDSWLARSQGDLSVGEEPGLVVMLVQQVGGDTGTVNFHFGLQAVSVGADLIGSASKPLFQIAGASLQGLELRGYLGGDYDADADTPFTWTAGGAALLDQIGLPLGPGFGDQSTETAADPATAQGSATQGGTNPAVSDTLSSGTGTGGNAATDQTDAIAPPFSMVPAYMKGGTFSLELLDEDGEQTDEVWYPIQRSYGPVFIRQLGLGWEQDDLLLSLIVDGGVSTSILTIELINLGVEIPITSPLDLTEYGLRLDGFDFDFKTGPIELSGGLLQNKNVDPTDYEGHALIKAWRIAISAMGAYSNGDGSPSLFVFAMLNMPLGGIPAMFVNGLSAGFGYNRGLKLPGVNEVNDFPLVAGLNDEAVLGDSTTSALAALDDWIYPSRGEYWLAGGIKWTNYEILNTNALLEVQFGNEFEVGVLGLSIVSLPQGTDKKFAYAELGLELVLDVGQGEFVASAVLSPNSFLIDKNFTITGGFALCAWWGDNVDSGDFVTSLGGYHPAVTVPDYYPELDRLGFSAAIGDYVSLYGDLYFALTTSNVMAGGTLQFQFDMVGLQVWFGGEADLILYWQPFYFDAHMDVSAGCSYTVTLFGAKATMQLTAGGAVDLWSPATGGRIEIDFWFLSFPMEFGAEQSPDSTMPVDWDGFKPMLPKEQVTKSTNEEATTDTPTEGAEPTETGANEQAQDAAKVEVPSAKAAKTQSLSIAKTAAVTEDATLADDEDGNGDDNPDDDLALVQIVVSSGLLNMLPALNDPDQTAWLVRGALFSFATSTPLPVTALTLTDGANGPTSIAADNQDLGILPMDATITATEHSITITNLDTGDVMEADKWQVTPQQMGMPTAIWGLRGQLSNAPELIPDCLTGAGQVTHAPHDALTGPPAFSMVDAFQYIRVDDSDTKSFLPLDPDAVPPTTGAGVADAAALDAVRGVEAAAPARSDVFAALAAMGVDGGTDGDLSYLAADPSGTLRGSPRLGTVQSSQGAT